METISVLDTPEDIASEQITNALMSASQYPQLREFIQRCDEEGVFEKAQEYVSENGEQIASQLPSISDLNLSEKALSVMKSVFEKAKKPLVVGVTVIMLLAPFGMVDSAYAAPDWDAIGESLEEENEELKEENEKLEQRLEMLREMNKMLEEEISEQEEEISEQEKTIDEANQEFRQQIKDFADDIDNISDEKIQWSIEVLERFDIFEDEEDTEEYLELFENH